MDPDLVRQQFDEEADARRAGNSTVAPPAQDAPTADASNVVPLILARTMSVQAATALAISPAPEPIPMAAGRAPSFFASSALAALAWTVASMAAILGLDAFRESFGQMTSTLAYLFALALGVGLTLDPLMKCERLAMAQALTLAGAGGSLSYVLTLGAFALAARDTGFPVPSGAYGLNVALNMCVALVLVACAAAAMLRLFSSRRKPAY